MQIGGLKHISDAPKMQIGSLKHISDTPKMQIGGLKTISDAPDTVFRCQRYLNCATVFNQLDRLQLAETIIPNIVTLLNFEQSEDIVL